MPMYVYPADVYTNESFNRLIALKRRFETVPFWVIVNPASGPGKTLDGNYTKAIDRLVGAGCVVLGYVTTSYGKRVPDEVHGDVLQWIERYPRISGIFFDEMIYEDTDSAAKYQAELTSRAHDEGLWPIVANPGAATPGRYFASEAADVIVIHEGDAWASEEYLKGDFDGGYADFPPFTRAMLVHSQPKLDRDALRLARKHVRWVYATEALFKSGDPAASNPWDRLSSYLEEICEELSKN